MHRLAAVTSEFRVVSGVLACALLTGCPPPAGSDAALDANDGLTTDIRADDIIRDDIAHDGGSTMDADGGDLPDAADVAQRHSITVVRTRFETAAAMLGALEMQQSGEPLAEEMGRDLAGYDRNALVPNLYTDPASDAGPRIDPAGYALAVESYEYSKYQMNAVAFESGPGTSLAYGPVINPSAVTGRAAHDLLRDRVQTLAIASRAGIRSAPDPDGGMLAPAGFVAVPAPSDNALNTLGFGGLWPTMHPVRSFDPHVLASGNAARGCTLTGGYGASAGMALPVGDYECGFSTLHLPMRDSQIDPVLTPAAIGFSAWKYGFWIVNYAQLFHDGAGAQTTRAAASDLANIGREGNTVVSANEGGEMSEPGSWLGSSDLEGFQAGLMIESLHNASVHVLGALTTSDGIGLSGFASTREALDYDYQSPLRYVPAEIDFTETADPEARFPRPSYALRNGESRLLDTLALLAGFTELYALTDRGNSDVGGSQTTHAYFDGDPFAEDDGLPDGDATPHDRWLAVAKVALVDIDRMHRRPDDVLVDTASLRAGASVPGATVSIRSTAYAVVVLRSARRALTSQLTLYANSTPDTVATTTALDATSWRGAPSGESIAQRITRLIRAQAELLFVRLTDASGRAQSGWNAETGAVIGTGGDLEAHASAIRGLLEAYLATGETRYRDRALAVFEHMDTAFWDARSRSYRTDMAGARVWTPDRFGVVQAALREIYKLIASRPGSEALAERVIARLTRTNKLVLNGWDDANDDGVVQWPFECARVIDGLPRGGLQLSERALTGELGVRGPMATSDRDRDCVPEVDDAQLASTLAAEITFEVR